MICPQKLRYTHIIANYMIKSKFFWLFVLCLAAGAPQAWAQYYGTNTYGVKRWNMGIRGGSGIAMGDVAPQFENWQGALTLTRHHNRKLDFRFDIGFGQYKGLDTKPSTNLYSNDVLIGKRDTHIVYYDTLALKAKPFYYNYRTQVLSLNILAKANLNRMFKRVGGEKNDLYVLGGFQLGYFATMTNILNAQGNMYDFPAGGSNAKALKSLMDTSYETQAFTDPNRSFAGVVGYRGILFGAGYRQLLYNGMAIGIEGTYTFMNSDLLDGEQWNESGRGFDKHNDHLLNVSLTWDYSF